MLSSSKTVQKVNNCSIIDLKTLKCSKKKRINKLTPTSRQLLSHMINVDFFSYRNMHLYRVDCSRSLKLQVFRYVLAALIDHPNQFLWSTQIWWGPFVLTPPNVDKTPRNL